jgi:hypothetical protein
LVDCAVVGVVVALVFVDDAAFAAVLVDLAAALTAIQPLSASIPTTLDTPVILRARRAGCGRRLRGRVWGAGVFMSTTIDPLAAKDLGAK